MNIEKQKISRYEMHKYWGKKPANGLISLLEKYSVKGDMVLDPFAGYGVFCAEAYIAGRNIIANDLNPIANFITEQLLLEDVDLIKVTEVWNKIKSDFEEYIEHWYSFKIGNKKIIPSSILRSNDGIPIKLKYKNGNTSSEFTLLQNDIEEYLRFESNEQISDWYPEIELICNSRISAKPSMTVADLFTKRTLACHARLLTLINQYASGNEKNLLLLAFTANLANCSKLVPPINSRGEMSQGAWMTGFYIGNTYVENNVLQYFENRLRKAINGKKNYTALTNLNNNKVSNSYRISSNDAKNLKTIPDSSVDYIFTDPPYGDTVPYFEQSIIWNSWLNFSPDYTNEIVVSDSKSRDKTVANYESDISLAISEIRRVLKEGKYFSMTYHSISGLEWKSITNGCIKNNFVLVEYDWLTQKSFTPRQLARTKTIKGDVLVTLKKVSANQKHTYYNDKEFETAVIDRINNILEEHNQNTNYILMELMKWVFEDKIIIGDVDVYDVLKNNFKINDNGLWHK